MNWFLKKILMCIAILFVANLSFAKDFSVGILEFENNSGQKNMEHLKKGIRDMLTTDIQCISGITILERARINDVLKEVKLTQTKYFKKDTVAKIGKLLGIRYILTGSYFVDKTKIRIDVRLIKVATSEVIYTEKIEGKQEDFFDLQKTLASTLVKNMKPDVSSKEMRRLNQLQTENYAVFDLYSKAVYEQERGNIEDAIRLMRQASKNDNNFKMAKEKLGEFQKLLLNKIEELVSEKQTKEHKLTDIMKTDFISAKKILTTRNRTPEYYVAYITLAVNYGLRKDFEKERDTLLQYWKEFSKEKNAYKLFTQMIPLLKKKSEFWEKHLMKIYPPSRIHQEMSFSNEAKGIYYYPRFVNIWPFCQTFGSIPPSFVPRRRREAQDFLLPHTFFYDDDFDKSLDCSDYWDGSSRNHAYNADPSFSPTLEDIDKIEIELSVADFFIGNPSFKISTARNESIRQNIYFKLDDFSPYDPDHKITKPIAISLVERLHRIASSETNNKQKLLFNQVLLKLVKFVQGKPPGDIQATGINIAGLHLQGDDFIIIMNGSSIRPRYGPLVVRKAIEELNPNATFNIITRNKQLFSDSQKASTVNIRKAFAFFKGRDGDEHKSIDERICNIYLKQPAKKELQVIIILNDQCTVQGENTLCLPYLYSLQPKKVSFTVLFNHNIKLSALLPKTFNNLISLLKIALLSGGKVANYVANKDDYPQDRLKKWLSVKTEKLSPKIARPNVYDEKVTIKWNVPSDLQDLSHFEVRQRKRLIKLPATARSADIDDFNANEKFVANIVAVTNSNKEVPVFTQLFIINPIKVASIKGLRLAKAKDRYGYNLEWEKINTKHSLRYMFQIDSARPFEVNHSRKAYAELPEKLLPGRHLAKLSVISKLTGEMMSEAHLEFDIPKISKETLKLKQLLDGSRDWEKNFAKKLRPLIIAGADPNVRSKGNETLLERLLSHYMWQRRYRKNSTENVISLDDISFLLTKGADVNITDSDDRFSMLYIAAKSHNLVKLLLKHGANPNFQKNSSPLNEALGDLESVKLLLEAGANVNNSENPPLQSYCFQSGDSEVGVYMLDKGANPNLADRYNLPPLAAAVRYKDSSSFIKLLLAKGAQTDYIDKYGNTLLHIAAKRRQRYPSTQKQKVANQNIEIVEILLKVGLNPSKKNKKGETPLDLAYDPLVKEMLTKMNSK